MKYVAFLRGINVGGNKLIKMADLSKVFESLGFKKVKTILASGNVIFETSTASNELIAKKIKEAIKSSFQSETDVIVRNSDEIKKLLALDPFQKIKVTPQTRFYVTFFSEKPATQIKLPQSSDFQLTHSSDTQICFVLTISQEKNTTDIMSILDKTFGRKITTRNWNTIFKIAKSLEN